MHVLPHRSCCQFALMFTSFHCFSIFNPTDPVKWTQTVNWTNLLMYLKMGSFFIEIFITKFIFFISSHFTGSYDLAKYTVMFFQDLITATELTDIK